MAESDPYSRLVELISSLEDEETQSEMLTALSEFAENSSAAIESASHAAPNDMLLHTLYCHALGGIAARTPGVSPEEGATQAWQLAFSAMNLRARFEQAMKDQAKKSQ